VTSKLDAYRGIVAAVDRMVNRGDEADAVLRAVVDVLYERLDHVSWVGISLVEDGELILGPSRGSQADGSRLSVPIEYEGRTVGELALEAREQVPFDDEDRASLGRVAVLISQHALVAWDTAGEAWNP
jgi:putative methionine-R-sulfoxide reductase with GAF domain